MSKPRAEIFGWVPAHAYWENGTFVVDWVYLGDKRYDEPFFEDTIRICRRKPFNRLFARRTSIDALAGEAGPHRSLAPSGFVFHMSRCGSTLVANMLAALEGSVVIREARPLDAILRAHLTEPKLPPDEQANWLRRMVAALGPIRRGDEKRLFIKFDSWNALALPLVRRTFPAVPWIFLYRNPVEVLVSHMRQSGEQTVPGELGRTLFGLAAAAPPLPREEYAARVLGRICESAAEHRDAGLLVNYRELGKGLPARLLRHFGIEPSHSEQAAMAALSAAHAKNSHLPFAPDGAEKRTAATAAERAAAETWIGPAYRTLEGRVVCGPVSSDQPRPRESET
jgi:hypothetical protein